MLSWGYVHFHFFFPTMLLRSQALCLIAKMTAKTRCGYFVSTFVLSCLILSYILSYVFRSISCPVFCLVLSHARSVWNSRPHWSPINCLRRHPLQFQKNWNGRACQVVSLYLCCLCCLLSFFSVVLSCLLLFCSLALVVSSVVLSFFLLCLYVVYVFTFVRSG